MDARAEVTASRCHCAHELRSQRDGRLQPCSATRVPETAAPRAGACEARASFAATPVSGCLHVGGCVTFASERCPLEELFSWPIATLDFEASALGRNSYPIEVGVCVWAKPDQPIRGWSALIAPTATWLANGKWDAEAAAIHRIRPEELLAGSQPAEVIAALNTILGTSRAWCDGGACDRYWARTLADASVIRPTFGLGEWGMLKARLDKNSHERLLQWLEAAPPRHRARDDAERLLKALGQALDIPLKTALDIGRAGEWR